MQSQAAAREREFNRLGGDDSRSSLGDDAQAIVAGFGHRAEIVLTVAIGDRGVNHFSDIIEVSGSRYQFR